MIGTFFGRELPSINSGGGAVYYFVSFLYRFFGGRNFLRVRGPGSYVRKPCDTRRRKSYE